MIPWWATFGMITMPDGASHTGNFVSAFIIITYALFANVLLVNLLVAMMADTYGKIKGGSEREYIYARYNIIFTHMHVSAHVPPPLNFPLIICSMHAKSSVESNDAGPQTGSS